MLTDREREELPPEAVLAIQSGRRSDAVEIVEEQLGVSHNEAMLRVQRAAQHVPSQVPQSVGVREDSGTLRLVVVLAVLAAIAAAFFALP
jgi:hypothetical protein